MTNGSQAEWAAGLGLAVPVVCAPMGGAAGGALASAVSRAGALGMIGMGSAGSVAALERELALLDTGGRPFGIGLVAWGIERDPAMLERALAAGPALVSVSFGDWEGEDPRPAWIEAVRASGALAVTQVATVAEARRAVDAGVDAVVARGLEGGGHGDHREPRDELLAAVVDAVDVPVLAAGAVSTAEDLAGVLAAGAAAAWVGTAFAACEEALTGDAARAVLVAADGADTRVSRVLDVALERPWPSRFPERLLRTPFVDRWQGREDELAADAEARAAFRAAVAAADYSVVPLDAGQGVGSVTAVRPAAEVVAALAHR
ncbi:NAD(P)H-dependent flavin oxidoreductase [Leucobacter triazinivorans]|uniref:Nitronate monooxygenase n=1 Tax=Leucobacter triazinivorans TaxID=1784719 RepID=A0A4P6KD26_9MICO|nr:nitronate monooxygenase [Leucobacter triazinivorans]QBE48187.1 nitronate monooxygenase [Leucobacter triazinivorans]